jgi:hypothetical protein
MMGFSASWPIRGLSWQIITCLVGITIGRAAAAGVALLPPGAPESRTGPTEAPVPRLAL